MTRDAPIRLIDHIGVDLWSAADAWKAAYTDAMVDDGFGYFAGAGSAILQFLGPQGARPAKVAQRLGITRQAVQQLIDTLEADGIVERTPDPNDGRAKIVRLTAKGAEAHWRGNIAKAALEARVKKALGAEGLARLKSDLARVTQTLNERHTSS